MFDVKNFDKIIRERRSIRIYDSQTHYDKSIVQRSLERALLSPNSSNMQLWEFYRVVSENERKKIAEFCMNQKAAVTAQELVVLVARPDRYKISIQRNLQEIDSVDNFESERSKEKRRIYYKKIIPLIYRKDFLFLSSIALKIFSFISGLWKVSFREVSSIDKRITIHKSIALAAQTFMLSVKAEGYDTCPMEGYDSKRIEKFLKLSKNAEINMIIAVGKAKYPEGVFYRTWRYGYNEVVKEI